ncbi:MAG: hypothetical protein V4517_05850 [Pseudomonadota bacterium]
MASAAPAARSLLAAEAVRYGQPVAAAEASRALAAAVERQPAAAEALRAQAGAAAGPTGAVVLQREAAAGAVPRAGAAAEGVVQQAAAVARQPAGAAAPRVGEQERQREARASASAFHPDQVHPWPARPPSVVASSTRRRCVMMVWTPEYGNEIGNQRISIGRIVAACNGDASFISTQAAPEGAIIHCAFRRWL